MFEHWKLKDFYLGMHATDGKKAFAGAKEHVGRRNCRIEHDTSLEVPVARTGW
jgi:hypothetical protein